MPTRPSANSAGACSYWYDATSQQDGSVVAVYAPGDSLPILQIKHTPISVFGMQLRLFVSDGVAGFPDQRSAAALPYDAGWHHVFVTWDSDLGEAVYKNRRRTIWLGPIAKPDDVRAVPGPN